MLPVTTKITGHLIGCGKNGKVCRNFQPDYAEVLIMRKKCLIPFYMHDLVHNAFLGNPFLLFHSDK